MMCLLRSWPHAGLIGLVGHHHWPDGRDHTMDRRRGACRVRRVPTILLLVAVAGLDTPRIAAQSTGAVVGISSYHLVSAGHGTALGGYVRKSLSGSVALVGSVVHFSDETTVVDAGIEFTQTVRMIFSEARIEVSGRVGKLSPFVGAGGGLGIGFGRQFGGVTLHVTGGARFAFNPRMAFTTAILARAVDFGRGRTLDFLIGLALTRPGK